MSLLACPYRVTALAASLVLLQARDAAAGWVELNLYNAPVICSTTEGNCRLASTREAAVPERAAGEVFIGQAAGQDGAPGAYLFFQVNRTNGATALIEILIPSAGQQPPSATYSEHLDGQRIFYGRHVKGRVELLPSDQKQSGPACACPDRRMELVFIDEGPDQTAGTSDDQVRRISQAVFSHGGGERCRSQKMLEVSEALEIGTVGDCPGGAAMTSPGSPGSSSHANVHTRQGDVGCQAEGDPYVDDSGCGTDDGSEAEYDSGSGCEGDSSGSGGSGCEGDSSGSGDSGCEGDSSSSDFSGCDSGSSSDFSGCDGDIGGAAACDVDATAATRSCPKRRARRSGPLGLLLPFVLLALFLRYLKRSSHRRPR